MSSTDQLLRARGPLKPGDREDRTVGCRQTQPQNCARHSLPTVCAFARADGICLKPPNTWKKMYAELGGRGKGRG